MLEKKDRPHCYIDHANKKSENYAANPYLFWLNQTRRERGAGDLDEGIADDRPDAEPES